MLKILLSMSEVGGLWKRQNNPACTKSVKSFNDVKVGHCTKVSRFGPAARKLKGFGSIPLRLSFLFKKVVVCGHCLVTLNLTVNVTLKWLSLLPILMQESFWW